MDIDKLISHLGVDRSPLEPGERMEFVLVSNQEPPGQGWRLVIGGRFNSLWCRSNLRMT